MNRFLNVGLVCGCLFVWLPCVVYAEQMGTAFTYQGQLKKTGVPVNGTADFRFTLWDAESDGSDINDAIEVGGVSITKGLFAVELDFETDIYSYDTLWLEVKARHPAGSGDFTTLTPRQRLTPVPFALALPGLHTRQNATSPNVIAGWNQNEVTGGVVGATLSGGGSPLISGNPRPNRVTDNYGVISGGSGNRAGDGDGDLNDANHATVGGGYANDASASNSTVADGWYNRATNGRSTVAGGWNNLASGNAATVSGGRDNKAEGTSSVVGGGHGNVVENGYATIGGGWANKASGDYATIGGGGPSNTSDTTTANRVTDEYGTVGGGGNNRAGNDDADPINARYTTVAGGEGNIASDDHATVGGGKDNTAGSLYNTIAGGSANSTSHGRTTIGGGQGNQAAGDSSTIGGGRDNATGGIAATIPGGWQNSALGDYSFATGRRAKANHNGSFVWADSTDADFASTGNNQFLIRASGGVGIGTADPNEQLTVAGTVESTSGGFRFPDGTLQTTAGSGLGLTLPYSGSCPCDDPHQVVPAFDVTNATLGIAVRGMHGPSTNSGYLGGEYYGVYGHSTAGFSSPPPVTGAGVLGVNTGGGNGVRGESSTGTGVRGEGATGVAGVGNWGVAGFGDTNGVYGYSENGHAAYFMGESYFSEDVGIGTETPGSLLDVQGVGTSAGGAAGYAEVVARFKSTGGDHSAASIDAPTGKDAILYFAEDGDAHWDIRHDADNSDSLNIRYQGGTEENWSVFRILSNGTTRVRVLEIVGGADLAEPFAVAKSKDGSDKIEPGMVVVIDPDHPGQLTLATDPYDPKVAGVISGAKGLKPGMVMKAEESSLANGDYPVALTGRVWCWCEAGNSPIQPGDLLTTSKTAGHAMRATDTSRASGAIIGKAMTSLDAGTGLVLVLVSLQ